MIELLKAALPHLVARLDHLRILGANSSDYKIGEEYTQLRKLIENIKKCIEV